METLHTFTTASTFNLIITNNSMTASFTVSHSLFFLTNTIFMSCEIVSSHVSNNSVSVLKQKIPKNLNNANDSYNNYPEVVCVLAIPQTNTHTISNSNNNKTYKQEGRAVRECQIKQKHLDLLIK